MNLTLGTGLACRRGARDTADRVGANRSHDYVAAGSNGRRGTCAVGCCGRRY